MTETDFKAESAAPGLREVAARAGVSRATASKALNDATMSVIARPTRERVQLAARELGYHPSAIARGLSRKRMDTIGIVMAPGEESPNDSPFFSVLFSGIIKAAARHHQNVTLFVGDTWKGAAESLPRFRDGRCDGFLIFHHPVESDLIPALLTVGMPTVLVNDQRDDRRLSWVDVDNRESARDMTEYLIAQGHRRITLITDNEVHLAYIADRITGYETAMIAAGLVPRQVNFSWGDSVGEPVFVAISALLNEPVADRPTAIFCTGDSTAAFVMAALQKQGVRVPDDISVAGFNDDNAAQKASPPLTTMRQPFSEIGEAAVSLLLEQIADRSKRGQHVLLPTQRIQRDSTGPVRF